MSPTGLTHRKALACLGILLVLITVFLFLLMRPGHDWGDDFALYLHHARNLIQGKPYSAVGLINNPAVPHLGPSSYPPGFPWMLAPILAIFGLNFTAFKALEILSLIVALLFCYLLFQDRLPPAWNLSLVALIGFNPMFWTFTNSVLSDLPFLMLAYGTLYLIQELYRRTKNAPPAAYGILIGACGYLMYAVRPHGLMLFAAYGVYELLRARKIRPILVVTALVACAGILGQMLYLGRDTRYNLVDLNPRWLAVSTIENVKSYREFWLNGYSPLFSIALFLVVLIITAVGIWFFLRSGLRIYDLFAAFYMAVVIAYPATVDRYLICVVPVLMLYMLLALRRMTGGLSHTTAAAALASAAAVVLFSYATTYAKADRGPIREGLFDPDFMALCHYIESATPPQSPIVFRKPRLLTFVTGRPGTVYQEAPNRADLWNFMRSIGAAYIVVADVPSEQFTSDRTYLRPFVDYYRDSLTPVYRNAHYQMFQVQVTAPQSH